jgi:hypothetical protein
MHLRKGLWQEIQAVRDAGGSRCRIFFRMQTGFTLPPLLSYDILGFVFTRQYNLFLHIQVITD